MMNSVTNKVEIPDRLYFRIGDVAELLGVKPYVLRYWESEFPMISPQKSSSGQRVYRRGDVETVFMIKHLLYEERYSIEGAKKRIKELRREGELKLFKEETVAGATLASAPPSEEFARAVAIVDTIARERVALRVSQEELKGLLTELRILTQTSIEDLFLL